MAAAFNLPAVVPASVAAARRVRSSPRATFPDACSAATPLRRRGCCWIPALAGVSAASPASRTTRRARVPRAVRRRDRLVLMVVVACVPISTMLRVEWRLDRCEPRAEPAQHVFQHGVAPDAQRVAHHLHLGVAIADVPGEAGELLWACGRDLEPRVPPGRRPHHGALPRHRAPPPLSPGRSRASAP